MKLVKYENNDNGTMQNLPYEKFISYGAEALTDSELLAIIIVLILYQFHSISFPTAISPLHGKKL